MDAIGSQVEKLLRRKDWAGARRAIRQALRREPKSHWLVTRMALTYYEQHRYREALTWSKAARRLAPRCPLVLWDYAGALDMLGRRREAAAVLRGLIRRGVERLATGDCGEGISWARGLVADAHYRIARIHELSGRRGAALRELGAHLSMRGRGCKSIYALSGVRALKRRLEEKTRG